MTYLYILFTSSIVENILTIQLISFLNLVKYENFNLAWALFILIWSSASAWWPLIVSRWQVIVNFSLSCCIFTNKKGYKLAFINPKDFILILFLFTTSNTLQVLGGYSEHEQNKKKSLTTRATNSNFKFTEPSCFNYLIS